MKNPRIEFGKEAYTKGSNHALQNVVESNVDDLYCVSSWNQCFLSFEQSSRELGALDLIEPNQMSIIICESICHFDHVSKYGNSIDEG